MKKGSKESRDYKIIFIKPKSGSIHHYTMSLKYEQNNLLRANLHITNEKKKQELIQKGESTKGAYKTLIDLALSFNPKALEMDKLILNERLRELLFNNSIPVENHSLFEGKKIIPLELPLESFINIETNKKIKISGEEVMKFVKKIKRVKDLDIYSYTKGLIIDTNGNFLVFKKDRGWYYSYNKQIDKRIYLHFFALYWYKR